MEKNRKKKADDATRKSVAKPSEYKSRESAGKTKTAEGQFQKAFGKAQVAPRKR